MFEIQGNVNTAVCYAKVIEDGAIEQIRRMCDSSLTEGARVRIMPDAHSGKGCTIGTTMTVIDRVCPNIVGVDIGCGMYTVKLNEREIDFEKLDAAAYFIPSGKRVWEGRLEKTDLTALRCFRDLKDSRRLERSLGTLGGGNHFIEADRGSDGSLYLVIHSGKEEFFRRREEIISSYKQQGRRDEIQTALMQLKRNYEARVADMPEDLCWLYGSYMEDYLHDVKFCQEFAVRSREKMAEILLEKAGLTAAESFHTIHNYISLDEMILRKGAISAREGEKVLIPINMRDGSVIAVGRGNPEWNFSAPHGAGRLLSRARAKETLCMEDFRASMEGIYSTSVDESTIDESPMAYKSIDDIIDVIRETVDITDVIKPVYNFKASSKTAEETGENDADD